MILVCCFHIIVRHITSQCWQSAAAVTSLHVRISFINLTLNGVTRWYLSNSNICESRIFQVILSLRSLKTNSCPHPGWFSRPKKAGLTVDWTWKIWENWAWKTIKIKILSMTTLHSLLYLTDRSFFFVWWVLLYTKHIRTEFFYWVFNRQIYSQMV